MKKNLLILIAGLIIAAAGYYGFRILFRAPETALQTDMPADRPESIRISSSAFPDGSAIPAKYTCDGTNISPPFTVSGIPEGTKSLVILIDDKDTPNGTWVHWLLWNIPTDINEIPENSVPAGAVQGKNGFGDNGYGGPCPPSGRHRYLFTLYAVDTYLNIPAGSTKEELVNAINTHVLSEAGYSGYYSR